MLPEGPMTAKSSPGLTTPETSRRRDRFSLTTCNPRKISCTGRESSGYTNCNAELSTLEQTNVWLRISFHFLAEDRILGSLDFNSIDNRIGTRRKFRKFGTIWERIIFYSSPGRNLYKKYFRNLRNKFTTISKLFNVFQLVRQQFDEYSPP